MKKILIPTKLDAIAKETLEASDYNVIQDAEASLESLVGLHPDASALIVRSENVTAEIIDQLPELKLIVRAGAGYNTIDTKYARRKGIDVMNTPGANSNAVAEQVVALILAAYRHIIPADISARDGKWEKKNFMGTELTEKVIGIVGLGNIGQLLVRRLQGFDCTILAYDPFLSQGKADELDVKLTTIVDIFTNADVVSLHIPENDETRGMVNAEILDMMKDGAMIVNCARAGVINEDDLRAAKKTKGIVYCNDVYAKDEAGDKPIKDVANIMLPHLGASTKEANFNAALRAAEQVTGYFDQGVTRFVVNQALPDGLDPMYQRLAFYVSSVAHNFLGKNVPTGIEVSLYGGLNEFSKWMTAPVVLGISDEFDPYYDYSDAENLMESKGIAYALRTVDDSKNYGKTMTIDLLEEQKDHTINKASVRGTVVEGRCMISRINGFEGLYFEPAGMSVLAEYKDQPGMLAKISAVLAKHDINIIDVRCPCDLECGNSLAVFKVNKVVGDDVLGEIKDASGAHKALFISLK
ncbi:MAG: ACT domain-containing protein [Lentisphaeria bacterium]|nr:NAD(P)-binding domain-containing protein [Lentisphaeria bacterium]NQZ67964.1 ACT domain-containing protein [Lentisphaeria bacterium]